MRLILGMGLAVAAMGVGTICFSPLPSSTPVAQVTTVSHHVKSHQGPRGPRGPRGYSLPMQIQTNIAFPGEQCGASQDACAIGKSSAPCPTGTVVIGGGFRVIRPDDEIVTSEPRGNTWVVIAVNHNPSPNSVIATAICAGV